MPSSVQSKSELSQDGCKIFAVHVQVHDVQNKIQEVFDAIRDTSWIEKLSNPTAKISYPIAAQSTIKKLTEEIFNNGTSPLTENTGEYVISVSASQVLNQEYNHTEVPISELWKEQKSGNPGFDFHSVNPNSILIFGEAKYKSDPPSPYGAALEQISKLISEGKDAMDLYPLEPLVGPFPIERFRTEHKGYAAAFSLNAKDCVSVMENVSKSKKVKPLMEYSEIYLIGVEFIK